MKPSTRLLVVILVPLLILSGGLSSKSNGQADGKKDRIKVPAPERILLETKDGVELAAQWFGGFGGKEALPVILVHDWDSGKKDLYPLAEFLQKKYGFAVIVPDLRGHGESLSVKGSDEPLDHSKFKKAQIATFIEDIDTCRRFLQGKNNEGELNLDLLAVVAVGKTCIHAIDWCISDWQWGPIGGVKQGQNVKALVLITPPKKFRSMSLTQSIKAPLLANRAQALPMLVIWGSGNDTAAKDAEFVFDSLKKSRDMEEFDNPQDQLEKQSLLKAVYPGNQEGTGLLQAQQASIETVVGLFIEEKVLSHKDEFNWQDRSAK